MIAAYATQHNNRHFPFYCPLYANETWQSIVKSLNSLYLRSFIWFCRCVPIWPLYLYDLIMWVSLWQPSNISERQNVSLPFTNRNKAKLFFSPDPQPFISTSYLLNLQLIFVKSINFSFMYTCNLYYFFMLWSCCIFSRKQFICHGISIFLF